MFMALGASQGCGKTAPPPSSPADYDRPVPADEPRKTLDLVVDLPSASDCEERFDLAIYVHRGVELVAWDDQQGACADRSVAIRYLTAKLNQVTLLELVSKHAKAVRPSEASRSRP